MSYLIVRASGEELERSLGVMGLVRAVLDRWAHVPGLRELVGHALEYRVACARAAGSDIRSIAEGVGRALVSE